MKERCLLLVLLIVRVQTTDPQFYTVFKSNDGKYPCYRQPAIVATNLERTHLIVFAEGRFVSSCAPPWEDERESPNENGGLESRRSEDSGSTWSISQTVYSGNIDFYTVVWDRTSNLLYLMLEVTPKVLIFTSGDEGKSWSDPKPLNAVPPPPLSKTIRPAVGHGIEIDGSLCGNQTCSDVGTLLMPFVCNSASEGIDDSGVCPTCYACVLKSEKPSGNADRDWKFSGIAQQYTRESQLVQSITVKSNISSIYFNGRNFSPTPGHRYFARSVNGADQFIEFGLDTSLIEPVTKSWTGVVCSLVRVSSRPSRILFSGPSNSTVRANLTLRLSYDEGQSWSVARVLFPGLSSYSDLAVVGGNESRIGVIFENGEETFADRISVAILSLSWLESTK